MSAVPCKIEAFEGLAGTHDFAGHRRRGFRCELLMAGRFI